MKYEFRTELWEYQAPLRDDSGRMTTAWTMATVPTNYYEDIQEVTNIGSKRGFGSVRVLVTIGSTTWKTSIFPDTKSRSYVLPIKKDVRKKENIEAGSKIVVSISLRDI